MGRLLPQDGAHLGPNLVAGLLLEALQQIHELGGAETRGGEALLTEDRRHDHGLQEVIAQGMPNANPNWGCGLQFPSPASCLVAGARSKLIHTDRMAPDSIIWCNGTEVPRWGKKSVGHRQKIRRRKPGEGK